MKKLQAALVILLTLFLGSVSRGNNFFTVPSIYTITQPSLNVLSADTLRSYLIVYNDGPDVAILKFGSTQTSSIDGIPVPSGGSYEPIEAPSNSMWARTVDLSPAQLRIVIGH